MDVGCYEFLDLDTSQELEATATQLLTVSDGSDDAGSMSFGWVIALPSGRHLTRCSGPAFSPIGSSFRAEGYSFLSVTRFLLQICNFALLGQTGQSKCSPTMQASSLALQQVYPILNLSPTLLSPLIGMSLIRYPRVCVRWRNCPTSTTSKVIRIRTPTAYQDLTLEAQLNVDADIEAGFF
jgi:hypothetical protein